MSRIAIYARKSTESDDKQVQSLAAQLEWARRQCLARGESNPRVYQEARSAKTLGRPEFERLMNDVEAGEIDVVVCYRADRLARNALDAGRAQYNLETNRLREIITVDKVYTQNSNEGFVLALELGLSSKYSKDLSAIVKRGMLQRYESGDYAHAAPFGYRNVTSERERRALGAIIPDPETAPYVTKLFEYAASGKYSLHQLTRLVVDEWRLGTPRSPADKKRRFPMSTISRVLKNPFYYGFFRVNGTLYPGNHKALVTKPLWDRVQASLAHRHVAAEHPSKRSFPFTGLVSCSECGHQFTAYTVRKKSGRTYTYYNCSGRSKKLCSQRAVPEARLLEQILPYLANVTITTTERALAVEVLHELNAEECERGQATTERLHRALENLRTQKLRLLDLRIAGELTKDEYDLKKADYEAQEVEIQSQLSIAHSGEAEWIKLAEAFFGSLTEAAQIFEAGTDATKKGLLRDLEIKLEVTPEELRLKAGKPTSEMRNRRGRSIRRTLVERVRTAFKERYLEAITA